MNRWLKEIKLISTRVFIKNHYSFLKYDVKKELRDTQQELRVTQQKLRNLQEDFLYHEIVSYFDTNPSNEYKEEIIYLKELGHITVFPYRQIKALDNVTSGFDKEKKMPYVIHKFNKRLYFPKSWSVEAAKENYSYFIQNEDILGGGYTQKSPHQYQTHNFCVKEGDMVLDIGSAEGLFSLDVIDIANRVYIFEPDGIWIEPLKATFEPYRDKVTIINKLVSNTDSANNVKLETCLDFNYIKRLFIKMDIEGSEKQVLEGNIDLFRKDMNIRVACCTYHKQNDAEQLKIFFDNIGYKTEYSDGYMIFLYDNNLKPPYFRNGLIRAQKVII